MKHTAPHQHLFVWKNSLVVPFEWGVLMGRVCTRPPFLQNWGITQQPARCTLLCKVLDGQALHLGGLKEVGRDGLKEWCTHSVLEEKKGLKLGILCVINNCTNIRSECTLIPCTLGLGCKWARQGWRGLRGSW